ncbi:adenine phosphoribosyltransferase [Tumebacillus flagellatus]|uniref:Adenine phosphoribosyltransferase n=1 Tax=Tumebacillus flagellatus TaxID=1157490 RepID=A0A074M8C7_9BACL|nr:adenine phosphoribosyltransferase [Tumebacillus flagellatus]KEO82237.1 adenine phosphoribosyltransferase [Tumebacillus flagellatus]
MDFKDKIRVIPDFPSPGIRFKDITTLLKDGPAFRAAIEQFKDFAVERRADIIAGPESRGFLLAAPMAYAMEKGFVPIRKPGKLPHETISQDYSLEYGKDSLEIHTDAIQPGQRVIIADDLLATGGTIGSTIQLVEKLGGIVVGVCFLIELTYLNGREKLQGYDVFSLIQY